MRCMFALVLVACHSAPASTPDGMQQIDAAPADAAPSLVTGTYVLRDVINNAQHLPAVVEMPFHSLTATVVLADGRQSPVAVQPDGSFSFERAAIDQQYRIAFVQDGGSPVEYQLAVPHLDISPRLWGHYDRAAVTPNTALAITATAAPGTGIAVVDSTGLWTQTGRSNGTNGAFTLDWTKVGSLSGPPGLLDAAANDRAFVVIHDSTGTASPAYTRLTAACSIDVSMTAGATTAASCTMAALTPDHCTHVVAPAVTELTRLTNALTTGPAFPTTTFNWLILSVPAPSLGPGGGALLAYVGGVPTADVDRDLTVFNNPFPGSDTTLGMTVGRTRDLSLPGSTTPLVLGESTQHYVKPAADCSTPSTVAGVIAIPTLPALDGVALDSDSLSLSLDPANPHDLTWSLAAAGMLDYWVSNLYEVTNVGGATTLALRRTWVVTDPHVTVDPTLLEPSKFYLISVVSAAAFSGAATGDFRTIGYPAKPFAFGTVLSAMFQVTN